MNRLLPNRRKVSFGLHGVGRNLADPLLASIEPLIDLPGDAWLLAEGWKREENHEQGNEAGRHMHLLRRANGSKFHTQLVAREGAGC